MMTENGPTPVERFTHPLDRTPWMAVPASGEAPDSALHDVQAVALGIAILLVIFILSSWVPA
jgi:hypothetical protein